MILLCYGTRPEYIKILPLMDEFEDKNMAFKVFFTGQHLDLLPSGATNRVDYIANIQDGENRLDSIVQSIMNTDGVWENDYDHVLVQGDTTSAFASALAAFHRKIPVIHLEAGLRTYDNLNPYPEEFNRQAVSRLASIHLCPTNLDAHNLRSENVQGTVYIVGNTVLDNLRKRNLEIGYNNKVLITMHRRENHDIIPEWFEQLNRIAKAFDELEFVYYAHPNPNVQKHLDLLKNVRVEKPLEYDQFISEVANCRFLITDSGGLQEESSFLRKKSVVCRKKTERMAGVGSFSTLCLDPDDLYGIVNEVEKTHRISEDWTCPYGNGHTSTAIASILTNFEKDE
jgi:UDP-N-acetylglucosamine 2-epimerase (non-hydrolysing)|tara:strand:- start:2379 stop:3401 length:1023 start_codon:yes stop_codon:yes gene_type:complete